MSEFVRQRVRDQFGEGKLYCAETVLRIVAEAGGRDSDGLLGLATGFCSGQARTCGQCGAVAGAIMGLGLYAGRMAPGEDHEPVYALVRQFMGRFEERFGSANCAELLGCDLGSVMGQARFTLKRLHRNCLEYTIFAADTVIDLLRESGHLSDEDMARMRADGGRTSC